MLYAILIILLVIFLLLFVLPGVIVFFLVRGKLIRSSAFTETFNNIMERMMAGVNMGQDIRGSSDASVSYQEALDILNLNKKDPTRSEVNKAYHKLMQSNHPDKGGSSYLAKKINMARDVLLKKKVK